jgi:hypothetical protein
LTIFGGRRFDAQAPHHPKTRSDGFLQAKQDHRAQRPAGVKTIEN